MSINYCTVSSSSLDSFCGAKRAIVFNRLVKELRPTPTPSSLGGGKGAHLSVIPSSLSSRFSSRDTQPVFRPTEFAVVTVQASFNGMIGAVSQDVTSGTLDLVYLTNLEIDHLSTVVNIESLRFNDQHANT